MHGTANDDRQCYLPSIQFLIPSLFQLSLLVQGGVLGLHRYGDQRRIMSNIDIMGYVLYLHSRVNN